MRVLRILLTPLWLVLVVLSWLTPLLPFVAAHNAWSMFQERGVWGVVGGVGWSFMAGSFVHEFWRPFLRSWVHGRPIEED